MNQNVNYDALKAADMLQFISECIKNNIMIMSQSSCNDCGKRECEYVPRPGQPVRINCPFWEARNTTGTSDAQPLTK